MLVSNNKACIFCSAYIGPTLNPTMKRQFIPKGEILGSIRLLNSTVTLNSRSTTGCCNAVTYA